MIPARSSSSWQRSWLMPQTSVKNVYVYASCIMCAILFLKIFSMEFCVISLCIPMVPRKGIDQYAVKSQGNEKNHNHNW